MPASLTANLNRPASATARSRRDRWFGPLYDVVHLPETHAYQHAERAFMLSRMLERLPGSPEAQRTATVAELGCGDGWVADRLAERFGRVVGFDLNPYRIGRATSPRVALLAAEGERTPLADASVDGVFSFAVFEHLPDRPAALRELTRIVRPGGWMCHVVPTATMKVLQYAGFLPEKVRRETRAVMRTVADRRTVRDRSGDKFHAGMETNNPRRKSRRAWHQKLLPRVHGEYDSNWQETMHNRVSAWKDLFASTGLRCTGVVPLGLWSPYFFGGAPIARAAAQIGLSSVHGFVLHRPDDAPSQPAERPA